MVCGRWPVSGTYTQLHTCAPWAKRSYLLTWSRSDTNIHGSHYGNTHITQCSSNINDCNLGPEEHACAVFIILYTIGKFEQPAALFVEWVNKLLLGEPLLDESETKNQVSNCNCNFHGKNESIQNKLHHFEQGAATASRVDFFICILRLGGLKRVPSVLFLLHISPQSPGQLRLWPSWQRLTFAATLTLISLTRHYHALGKESNSPCATTPHQIQNIRICRRRQRGRNLTQAFMLWTYARYLNQNLFPTTKRT